MICDSATDLDFTAGGSAGTPITPRDGGKHGIFGRLSSASRQDLMLFAGCLIGLFCLNGEHAMLVCNFCSSAPAAFFSYRLVNKHEMPVSSMKAILGFWILFSMLLPADHLFGRAFGYFTVKFLLLVAALGHVCSKSKLAGEMDVMHSGNEQPVCEFVSMNGTRNCGDFHRHEVCSNISKVKTRDVPSVRRREKTPATLTSAVSDFDETDGRGLTSTMREDDKTVGCRQLNFHSSVTTIAEEKCDEDLCDTCNLIVHGH